MGQLLGVWPGLAVLTGWSAGVWMEGQSEGEAVASGSPPLSRSRCGYAPGVRPGPAGATGCSVYLPY